MGLGEYWIADGEDGGVEIQFKSGSLTPIRAWPFNSVKKGNSFQIKLQRVDMFNSQVPYDYVHQIGV